MLTKVLPRVSQKTVTDITTFVDKSGKVGQRVLNDLLRPRWVSPQRVLNDLLRPRLSCGCIIKYILYN